MQVHPTLRIVSPDEFRRAAFPDQTSDDVTFAYPIPETQQKLLSSQAFRDRVAPLRLRYLVSVGEKEESRDLRGYPLVVAIAFGWNTSLGLTASVIDLKDGREVGQILIRAEGDRGILLLFFLLPIWWVETVRGPVCTALGEGLGNFLAGRGPASSTTRTIDE